MSVFVLLAQTVLQHLISNTKYNKFISCELKLTKLVPAISEGYSRQKFP